MSLGFLVQSGLTWYGLNLRNSPKNNLDKVALGMNHNPRKTTHSHGSIFYGQAGAGFSFMVGSQ
jgi:hypothetical protein